MVLGNWTLILATSGPSELLGCDPTTELSKTLSFFPSQKQGSSPKPLPDSDLLRRTFLGACAGP